MYQSCLMAKKKQFLKCSWDTNLVFNCEETQKSGPQALNTFVVQQLLDMLAFVLEFRKSSQKIEHVWYVNLKLTCFVVQG